MKSLILYLIFLLSFYSCTHESKKPNIFSKWHLYKIDNEIWADKGTNDLVTVLYQVPQDLMPIDRNEALNLFGEFKRKRALLMELSEDQRGYSKCFASPYSDEQIIVALNSNSITFEELKSNYIKLFNDLKIGDDYLGQKLIGIDTVNCNLFIDTENKTYCGFTISSFWQNDTNTIHNTSVLFLIDGYLFYTTINLLNATDEKHKEIKFNFIKSLWIKIEKNGRGYGYK